MKSFAFAALAAAASALNNVEFEYMNYMAQFNKYSNDMNEFQMRLEQFTQADAFIKENNASDASHVAGHNQFSDWTYPEYKSILGYRRGEKDVSKIKYTDFEPTNTQ